LEALERYKIDLKEMKTDSSSFTYLLDNHFFSLIEGKEVYGGDLKAKVKVDRVGEAFELRFNIEGLGVVTCDRCLDDMACSISVDQKIIVELGDAYNDEDDTHLIISAHEGTLNVAWLMYEFIALALPIHHAHEEGDCNQEMLNKLDEVLTVNAEDLEESDEDDDETPTEIDPRWNELKKILDK
jgi:uncharacterized metal-binding protein YceD (DUF177 family)